MAPKSPVKKPDGKLPRGNMRSRSRIPQRTKGSVIKGVQQKASAILEENVTVASTSKVNTPVRVVAPAAAPYQSTPKRSAVSVKPSRVTKISPDRKVSSPQVLEHKLKGSPHARQRPSRQTKENQSPDARSRSSKFNTKRAPLSSQNPSKSVQSKTDWRLSSSFNSPQASSSRRSTRTVVASIARETPAPSRRHQSILKITQPSTFVRSGNKSRISRSSGRRSSSLITSAAVLEEEAGHSKGTTILESSPSVLGSPEAVEATSPNRNTEDDSNRDNMTLRKSFKESLRKSTSLQGTVLLAKTVTRSAFHTPVPSVINGTPSHQGRRGLNTPFRSQAPKSARRRSPVQQLTEPVVLHSNVQRQLWDQQIRDWLFRPWKLCFMSALSGFQVQTQNLRTAYQNTLRQLLSDSVPFNVQVTLEPQHCFSRDPHKIDVVSLSISYSVPVEWDLRQQRETAVAAMASGDAALAAASSRHKTGKNKALTKTKKVTTDTSKRKTLYKALLVRGDMSGGEVEGVSWYPLYFYSGRQTLHHTVVGWLQDSFGGLVCIRSLRAPALMWAAGLWLQQPCGAARDDDDDKEQVVLAYQLTGLSADGWQQHDRLSPSNVRVADVSTLTLEVPVREIRKIAKCIVPEESAEGGSVAEGERNLLHSVVQDLVHFLTELPQAALRLKAVNTACVSISATGEVKVMCKRHLQGVLDFLLELHKENSLLDQVTADASQDLDSSRDSLDSE